MMCVHNASDRSTLVLMEVRSVLDPARRMYSCKCSSCGRMTDWFKTKLEAQAEAWCGCWMKEA